MIPSIVKILKVENFKVLVMWDNEEVRVIDFAKNFDTWKKENNTPLFPLMNKEVFEQVRLVKVARYNRKMYLPKLFGKVKSALNH